MMIINVLFDIKMAGLVAYGCFVQSYSSFNKDDNIRKGEQTLILVRVECQN